jgi:hypothetical protein
MADRSPHHPFSYVGQVAAESRPRSHRFLNRPVRLYAVLIPRPAIQHRLNAAVIILPLMANSYDMDNYSAYARALRLSLLRLDQAREVLTPIRERITNARG